MENTKDENGLLHPCHTFLLQKNKEFVSDQRRKRFHRCISLPPGERNNDFSHLQFRFDKHGPGKFREWAVSLFPFHGSAHCWYVCVIASQDFVAHKMYPAYHWPDWIRAS